MPDPQRKKLLDAEQRVWVRRTPGLNPLLDDRGVIELVDEYCTARADVPVAVNFVTIPHLSFRPHVAKLQVPPWAHRPLVLLHDLVHHTTDPVFPPHGAEFARDLLSALHDFASPALAEELLRAFDDNHVHHDSAIRRTRVRRQAVNAANQEPGVMVELIVDDPPELITGALIAVHQGVVLVGDREVDLDRGRYLNLIR